MCAALPEWIEPTLLAERGAQLAGRVVLASMERLRPLLAAEPDAAWVELAFAIDARGLRTVHGRVQAEVALACQRCLQPVACTIDSEFHLAAVTSVSEERRLPEGLEPLDCSQGPLATAVLVEDELLLGLPLVASHPDAGCNEELAHWQGEDEAGTVNPFDVLRHWQDKRRDD
jgi:uncharacterized protein